MKKLRIILVICIVFAIMIAIGLYLDEEENKKIDAEAITLGTNLTVEFGKVAKVSDFIENINGMLLNDYEIDTETLGEIQIDFEFMNIRNRKRKSSFVVKVIDVNAPKILSGASYTVTKGSNKVLTDVLLSGDDIDDSPQRAIIGDYDMNIVGDYNLTYVVTDASGNSTKKDFVLHVVDVSQDDDVQEPVETEVTYFDDVIDNYKNNDTKIGIDVSKWQGDIDWEKVKNAGVEFAIIRMRISNRL